MAALFAGRMAALRRLPASIAERGCRAELDAGRSHGFSKSDRFCSLNERSGAPWSRKRPSRAGYETRCVGEGQIFDNGLSRQDCALPRRAPKSCLRDRRFVAMLRRNIHIPFDREKPPSNPNFPFVRCGKGGGCIGGTVNLCLLSPLDGTKRGCQRTPAAILTLR